VSSSHSINAANPVDHLGDYELHTAWEGFSSIRQRSSGEIMHSRSAPMAEARQLYVEQSRLAQRLNCGGNRSSLLLWDVGLGAAANAMAAIECHAAQAHGGRIRPMQIVSFENDLDSLRLALRHLDRFPYLDHPAPQTLLRDGRWQSDSKTLTWELLEGDFIETMQEAAPPDIIFYDMFSSRCSPEPWSFSAFEQLATACANHATELFTYTRSTANRAKLLAAGFYLARGRSHGKKEETTIALSPESAKEAGRYNLLDCDWLKKWERSAARFEPRLTGEERETLAERIRSHPQFG
jgi:queuine tRNA-ribosyltransferase